MSLVIGAVILWILPIFVANSIGKAKNRSGLAYGILLGWLGVIIVAILPPVGAPVGAADEGTCPYCAEKIKLAASFCKHCGREVRPNPQGV